MHGADKRPAPVMQMRRGASRRLRLPEETHKSVARMNEVKSGSNLRA